MTSRNPAVVDTLLARVRAELAASFSPDKPIRLAHAPARLDVMGGLTAYTGGLLLHSTLDCGAAVAIQPREDRNVQVFSFDLFDQQKPFTLIIPLEALAHPLETLKREFAESGRTWAAAVVGCLAILHDEKLIDSREGLPHGFNVALLNTIPPHAGLASNGAMSTAAMVGFVEELGLRSRVDPAAIALMCSRIDEQLIDDTRGVEAFVAPLVAEAGALTQVLAQPFELKPPLRLPAGVRVIAVDSGVRASEAELHARRRVRTASFIGHKLILEKMRQLGAAAGRELIADPMNGYLANLGLNDYKRFFRPYLPESLKGGQFLLQHHATIDPHSRIEPDFDYPIQQTTDYHVLDANRAREFARYLEEAHRLAMGTRERTLALDKAGHLLYASHIAYAKDAQLGAADCDVLVDLLRAYESSGIYGARMTASGSGGTIAVLCKQGESTDRTIEQIVQQYIEQTGRPARAFFGNESGAWTSGSVIV